MVKIMVERWRRKWTLRCRDLLSTEAFVVTELDDAGDGVLHQITGSKPVVLSDEDVVRLIRQLEDARRARARRGPAA